MRRHFQPLILLVWSNAMGKAQLATGLVRKSTSQLIKRGKFGQPAGWYATANRARGQLAPNHGAPTQDIHPRQARRNSRLQVGSALFLIGTEKKFHWEDRRVDSQIDGERQGGLSRGRGPHLAGPPAARKSQPDRDPCRLRHQPMRWQRGEKRGGGRGGGG